VNHWHRTACNHQPGSYPAAGLHDNHDSRLVAGSIALAGLIAPIFTPGMCRKADLTTRQKIVRDKENW